MSQARYDILGLGNAIVDIISPQADGFLADHALIKGSMALIDEMTAERLLSSMDMPRTISGGSAANTVIGAAGLGCRACFMGRVRDDRLGTLFTSDIGAAGVAFPVPHARSGPATARCFVIVTPDGQRTMNTYLGACQDLTEDDIDPATVRGSRITYLEGYLWDPPAAKAAFLKAASIAHEAGRLVALSLSDAFCVGRYRAEFMDLITNGTIDILFANEAELLSLYEESRFDEALGRLARTGVLAAVTRGEKGSVVVHGGRSIAVPAAPVAALVDTTGAGDLFAAGFLAGLVRDLDHERCARLGALAASEIIQHLGARPQNDLQALARQHFLLT